MSFFLMVLCTYLGGIVFVLFTNAEVQPWAMPESEKKMRIEMYTVSGDKMSVNSADDFYSYSNKGFSDVSKETENETSH